MTFGNIANGHDFMQEILYTGTARCQWRALPPWVQGQLSGALARFIETGAGDVLSLQGRAGLRLRSGDYRLIFIMTQHAVEIIRVGHRRDVYR